MISRLKVIVALALIAVGLMVPWSTFMTGRLSDERKPDDERIKQLKTRVDAGDWDAILELGATGDRRLVPYLRELLHHHNKASPVGPVAYASIALARLGERDQLEHMIADATSDDPHRVHIAAKMLGKLGTKDAVAQLGILLHDQTGYRNVADLVYEPPSHSAIRALSELFPNGSPKVPRRKRITDDQVKEWRDWWDENKQTLAGS